MKYFSLFLFGCIVFFNAETFAQSVNSGAKAYENGDYKGAITILDEVLQSEKLNEKDLAKGHYYRAMAQMVYVRKNKGDMAPEIVKTAEDAALIAASDLDLARKYDVDGKMTAELESAQKALNESLLELAGYAKNAAYKKFALSEAQKKERYTQMVALCAPAMASSKFDYRSYALTADAQLGLGEFAKALANYHLADDWFFRSAPKTGDQNIAYVYIHIAELEWQLNKNYEGAMAAIAEGRETLGGESKKIQSLGQGSAADKAGFSKQHDIIVGDIKQAEVEIQKAAGKYEGEQ